MQELVGKKGEQGGDYAQEKLERGAIKAAAAPKGQGHQQRSDRQTARIDENGKVPGVLQLFEGHGPRPVFPVGPGFWV